MRVVFWTVRVQDPREEEPEMEGRFSDYEQACYEYDRLVEWYGAGNVRMSGRAYQLAA